MKLTGKQMQLCQEALLRAFPTYSSLARMVRFGLDESLGAIAGPGSLSDVAFSLISWAESQGRIDDLLTAASEENPGNLSLQDLRRVLQDATTVASVLPTPTPLLQATLKPGAVEVFYSYSHRDEALKEHLVTHLAVMRRNGEISEWHDRKILPGEEWAGQIDAHLESAQIVLLLISADFLASDYCYDVEMMRAMERHAAGDATVIPVILRASDWKAAPFGKLQALPREGRPVTSWANSDEAWVDVAQGLHNVVKSLTRAPRAGAQVLTQIAHPVPAPKIIQIGDIFRTTGQPDITFVEPSQMPLLEGFLRTMGQGLVVEGPSGIGKTTATRRALEKVRQERRVLYLTSKDPKDLRKLDRALEGGFNGHLVVDDFHHLDESRRQALAALIKTLADQNRRNAKLTIIGINPVGDSLVAGFPDLAGRFMSVPMETQPRAKLEELIHQGETAANVIFRERAAFVEASEGSFFTAQQLCLHAAMAAQVMETQPVLKEIEGGPRDVVGRVLESLRFKYYQPLSTFAIRDEVSPPRGAVLAILWLLSQENASHVTLHDAQMRYPELSDAFDWLRAGNLAKCLATIPQLSRLFFYGPGVLSAEDPQLKFYLRNLEWVDFATRTGHHVRLHSRRGLVFESQHAPTRR